MAKLRALGSFLFTTIVLVACSSTARVSSVYTALDTEGTRKRSVFYTDTNDINCVAEAGIGRPGVTIEGVFHQIRAYDFKTNAFFATDRYLGYTEFQPARSTSGPTKINFALQRLGPDGKPKDDAPFVAGSYICEVSLDGEVQGTAPFNIDFPPCPTAEIIKGTPCFGYYPENQDCPRYGDKSADPARCACRTEGWECS